MNKTYLKLLQEQRVILNEGGFKKFWFGFLKIFVSGRPNKHPKLKVLDASYERALYRCKELFPDTRVGGHMKSGKREGEETSSMGFEYYQANPKGAQCKISALIIFLEGFIKLLKKEGSAICEYNKFKDKCQKWVDAHLPEAEIQLKELKALAKVTKSVKAGKEMSMKVKWNRVMGG